MRRLFGHRAGRSKPVRCATCRHFIDEPRTLERAMPGWASLGSAFGAVRGDDGLCGLHGRHLSARAGCAAHCPKPG